MFGRTVEATVPIENYEATSAEVERILGGKPPAGLICHIAAATSTGFRVTEVWDSREQAEQFDTEILRPLIDRMMRSMGMDPTDRPPTEVLDVRRVQVGTAAHGAAV